MRTTLLLALLLGSFAAFGSSSVSVAADANGPNACPPGLQNGDYCEQRPACKGHGEGVTATGTNGDDDIKGTECDDQLSGAGGDDKIQGKNGDDELDGGSGNDTLEA